MEDLKKRKEKVLNKKSNQKKGPGSRATKIQSLQRIQFILEELGEGKSVQLIYTENHKRWDISQRQVYNLYRRALNQIQKAHLNNLEESVRSLFVNYQALYFKAVRSRNNELALKINNSMRDLILHAESFKTTNKLDLIINKFNLGE